MTYEEGILREQLIYKEEAEKFDRLAELASILDQPIICPKWNMKVLRPNGDIRVERDSFNHSWTRNGFNVHTQLSFFGPDGTTATYADGGAYIKETDGTLVSLYLQTQSLESDGYDAAVGDTTFGIIVGTGNTAEALNDFEIETIIDDGNGAGEMEYGDVSKELDAWDAGNSRWESQWERYFDNLSGNPITVNEFALYHYFRQTFTPTTQHTLCMIRDIINPGQAVAHTERLVINQEFRVIIP